MANQNDFLESNIESKDKYLTNSNPLSINKEAKVTQFLSINPMFLNKRNVLRLEFSQSIQGKFEKIFNLQFIYSQPNRIFRLPGRLNLELGGFFGQDKKQNYDLFIAGILQEIALPLFISHKYSNFKIQDSNKIEKYNLKNFSIYIGLGLGIYIKSRLDTRVFSAFSFGQRLFLGANISCIKNVDFSLEIFLRHYSNGDIQMPNIGYNFIGASFGIAF